MKSSFAAAAILAVGMSPLAAATEVEGLERVLRPGRTPPDRLALNPKSPFYNADLIARGVGVRFKGVEIFNCAEYCVSEGWVRRIPQGGTYRSTVKLQGAVEVWFRS